MTNTVKQTRGISIRDIALLATIVSLGINLLIFLCVEPRKWNEEGYQEYDSIMNVSGILTAILIAVTVITVTISWLFKKKWIDTFLSCIQIIACILALLAWAI